MFKKAIVLVMILVVLLSIPFLLIKDFHSHLDGAVLENVINMVQGLGDASDDKKPLKKVGIVNISEPSSMRIAIPAIDIDLPVIFGDVYSSDLLKEAPVHYEMSALPGTGAGNVAIAGHRASDLGHFTYLDKLKTRDAIYLEIAGYCLEYSVEWIRIIEPDDWSVVEPTDYPAVTLTTCEPLSGPSTHRLVVRGRLRQAYLITGE